MQKISTFLWFEDKAEEAMKFYVSVFDNAKVTAIHWYPEEPFDEIFREMSGKVLTGVFELEGREFLCLDGGPKFKVNPSISHFCQFDVESKANKIWDQLIAGGKSLMEYQEYPWAKRYGWLQDKYGISWQISYSENPVAKVIRPALMFTQDNFGIAREAMTFYATLFEESAIDFVAEYVEGEGDVPGFVKHATFHLGEDHFVAMDSSADHKFTFNEGVSLLVRCEDQPEIDRLWAAITTNGGQESQCGWCKDRFGVSWQITPRNMEQLIVDKPNAVQAMMKMKKLDIAVLQAAGD